MCEAQKVEGVVSSPSTAGIFSLIPAKADHARFLRMQFQFALRESLG
jgi:hypothetical protein